MQQIEEIIENSIERLPFSGCWIWLLSVNKKGYGLINIDCLQRLAHRVSWRYFIGKIPENTHVLHKCDVPSCINPAHLFLGSNLDNIADRVLKGRGINGERHPFAKLSAQDVSKIRSLAGSKTQSAIAIDYEMNQSILGRLLHGKTWKQT